MNTMSGSDLRALGELCERNGLRDIAVEHIDGVYVLWATTGYMSDGSPIVAAVTHADDVHGLRENVRTLAWAWGRK